MWHVSSRSGVATLRTAIQLLLTYLLTSSDSRELRRCLHTGTEQLARDDELLWEMNGRSASERRNDVTNDVERLVQDAASAASLRRLMSRSAVMF